MIMGILNILGLFITMIGAALLYKYSNPTKKEKGLLLVANIEGVFPYDVDEANKLDEKERNIIKNKFFNKVKKVNRYGFLLISVGTSLQLISAILSTFC